MSTEGESSVYILIIRFKGGCNNYNKLRKQLRRQRGWKKIPGLTQAYAKDLSDDQLQEEKGELERFLPHFVDKEEIGGRAEVVLAKIIAPEEARDPVEDVRFLFTRGDLMNATDY